MLAKSVKNTEISKLSQNKHLKKMFRHNIGVRPAVVVRDVDVNVYPGHHHHNHIGSPAYPVHYPSYPAYPAYPVHYRR